MSPSSSSSVGDMVVTASGEHRPVRWLGHRKLDCTRQTNPELFWPVRITANAFGPSLPARDLLVSPGHAICVDVIGEILIPVLSLVNGATVAQVQLDVVTYWHVELDSHDLVLAEGLVSESYNDIGNRAFFAEADAVGLGLAPDAPRNLATSCRPFVIQGAVVDVVRDRLRARAIDLGWHVGGELFGDMYLLVDGSVHRHHADGLTARFNVPATAKDVWLISSVSVPALVIDSDDVRSLGLPVQSIVIDDGLSPARNIPLDDARFQTGFHEMDATTTYRWTVGRTRLPASLWSECQGTFFLRIELAGPALHRWLEPQAVETRAAA